MYYPDCTQQFVFQLFFTFSVNYVDYCNILQYASYCNVSWLAYRGVYYIILYSIVKSCQYPALDLSHAAAQLHFSFDGSGQFISHTRSF